MATTTKSHTAEALEALPDDGKRYELIVGELHELAPTVNWHGEGVEILSKSDTLEEINDRSDDWLNAGVRMLWIVDPFRHTVTIYRPGHDTMLLGQRATLEGDPVVPGFRCPVAEFCT
jgi:Uma2 family endonuclease